uniref:DNA primase n=1 Tax=candidate division CPR3 bacterium TaxID=2268181 RepID=A0A7C5URB7_UNCC3
MVDRSLVDEIKRRLNIVDIVRERVPDLKKRGKNYFALCPFHSEKNPSFSVNEELQIYKCFGCGASGDIINFIEKFDRLTFIEAIEKLAEKAGIDIEKFKIDPEYKKKKETALKIHKILTHIYHSLLIKHKSGNTGRIYLKKRSVANSSIQKFKLGWAPAEEDLITKWFISKGFKQAELVEAGISIIKGGKVMDKFRRRVMFPIFDANGNPIAFIGRSVDENTLPKYLNTPETVIYQKGKTVYGLNFAKNEIEKKGFVIVTEGTMNVISSYEIGSENIVAILGTGFTTYQAELLKRYTDNIYFAFDSDSAGRAALLRAAPIALEHEFNVKVIDIPYGKDIDECIKADPKSWIAALNSPSELIEWLITFFKSEIELDTIEGKTKFIKRLKPFILAVKNPIGQELWIKRIGKEIGVGIETIKVYLTEDGTQASDVINPLAKLSTDSIEKYLLGIAVQYWHDLRPTIIETKDVYFSNFPIGRALKKIVNQLKMPVESLRTILDGMGEDERKACQEVALMDIGVKADSLEKTWNSLISRLRVKSIENAIYTLKKMLGEAEKNGDAKSAKEYLSKIQKLEAKLKKGKCNQ